MSLRRTLDTVKFRLELRRSLAIRRAARKARRKAAERAQSTRWAKARENTARLFGERV